MRADPTSAGAHAPRPLDLSVLTDIRGFLHGQGVQAEFRGSGEDALARARRVLVGLGYVESETWEPAIRDLGQVRSRKVAWGGIAGEKGRAYNARESRSKAWASFLAIILVYGSLLVTAVIFASRNLLVFEIALFGLLPASVLFALEVQRCVTSRPPRATSPESPSGRNSSPRRKPTALRTFEGSASRWTPVAP